MLIWTLFLKTAERHKRKLNYLKIYDFMSKFKTMKEIRNKIRNKKEQMFFK